MGYKQEKITNTGKRRMEAQDEAAHTGGENPEFIIRLTAAALQHLIMSDVNITYSLAL